MDAAGYTSEFEILKSKIDAVLKDVCTELRDIMFDNNSVDIEDALIAYLEKRRYTILTDADVHGF